MDKSFTDTFLPLTSISDGQGNQVASDVFAFCVQIVNICLIGDPNQLSKGWVLVDAGMPGSSEAIRRAAEERYGPNTPPQAIILTHGHFDHVGAIEDLLKMWDVPVYAHELELPYLTGISNYPPGDSRVDGGLVSELSPLFPNHGINLGTRVHKLPHDGSVPGLPDWRWVHTPGHTPGHISLFRIKDKVLVAGDAFVTVKQESLYKVITQEQEISGPPKYFTTDWNAAKESVRKLEALHPSAAVTGHGTPMSGSELEQSLSMLAEQFDGIAVPEHGRFVHS
ncbi:MBL fold metallo-hydrolase [Paenibacillus hexagrammi]|uniref:MBL fold metallo-hydrolase n=1 Tax=Paenibacillus hexagrammi TaxID=2908839 RepID=A0ABY3SEU8_9BACL|nr:MBL fold metallo-hydrolase [Paenibacillus sp. YPD9-1]UJF31711.1 MBL fold metallo-hydrolase [Paenibacillus sp. YPD9-1]